MQDDVVALFAYDRWANTKDLDACRKLTAEQYVAEPVPGWSSVRSTIDHIAWVRKWATERLGLLDEMIRGRRDEKARQALASYIDEIVIEPATKTGYLVVNAGLTGGGDGPGGTEAGDGGGPAERPDGPPHAAILKPSHDSMPSSKQYSRMAIGEMSREEMRHILRKPSQPQDWSEYDGVRPTTLVGDLLIANLRLPPCSTTSSMILDGSSLNTSSKPYSKPHLDSALKRGVAPAIGDAMRISMGH